LPRPFSRAANTTRTGQKNQSFQRIAVKAPDCVDGHILHCKPGLDYNYRNSPGMEPAMTITFTSSRMNHRSHWNEMKQQFAEWRRRARSRNELHSLSDQTLRDIGVSRCDVHREVSKPFWMA
jgi:uncharacterized protein YjiS (DUF1127 family)